MDSRKEAVKERPRKVYNCSECRYYTTCRSNFNKHCKIHNRVNEPQTPGLVCDRCGKKYVTKFGLELHIKTKHEKKFKHLCEICGKGFNQSIQYRLHLSSHVVLSENICPMCKAEFCVEASLKRHMRICKERDGNTTANKDVSDNCRHMCDECHTSYATKNGLQSHIKGMHQGAEFECNMCDKTYRWRSSLKAHLKCAHRYTNTTPTNIAV